MPLVFADIDGLDEGSTKDQAEAISRKKKVGNYLLLRTLGEGSFAKVRQGYHIISREKVAVKIVSKKAVLLREYVKRNVRREAVMLQRLEHPHIVRLYEIMETGNSYYLVLELAEEGEFIKYLANKQCLGEEECRKYIRQVASALDHMHTSNIAHRDLKLENLMLDRDHNIKIIDFGLSNVFYGRTSMSTQCGSPVYAAPEIFCNKKYGPSADVWSMGVCMYAMLTGNLPFTPDSSNNLTSLHSQILKGVQFPDNLSKGCKDLLSRMLTVDVDKRISVDDILVHPWLLEGSRSPILTRQPPIAKLFPTVPKQAIVHYMVAMFNFQEKDIFSSVIERKMNAIAATYHLLLRRLESGSHLIGFPENSNNKSAVQKKGPDPVSITRNKTEFPLIQRLDFQSEPSDLTRNNHKLSSYKSYMQQLKDSASSTSNSRVVSQSVNTRRVSQRDISIRRRKTRAVLAKQKARPDDETNHVPEFLLTYETTQQPDIKGEKRYEWEQTFIVTKQEPKKHERGESTHLYNQGKNEDSAEKNGTEKKVMSPLPPPQPPRTPLPPPPSSASVHLEARLSAKYTPPSKLDLKLNVLDQTSERGGDTESTHWDDSANDVSWSALRRQKSRLKRGVNLSHSKTRGVGYGVSLSAPKTLTPREGVPDDMGQAKVVGQGRRLVERAQKYTREEWRHMWGRKADAAMDSGEFPDIFHPHNIRAPTRDLGYRAVNVNGFIQFPDVLSQATEAQLRAQDKQIFVDGVVDVIKVHITSSAKYSGS